MKTIDTFTPPKSMGLRVLLSAANPKNLLLIVGAAAAIAQTGTSTGDQAVALAVFVLLGTLGPGIPVGIYFFMGARGSDPEEPARLDGPRERDDHGCAVPDHRREADR
jgi:hypothetical protein